MRRYLAAVALLAPIAVLDACVSPPQVANDVLAAEQTLTATERMALIYTSLPRCGGAARVCSDPATVQRIKDLDNEAYMAVVAARNNQGTLSAALAAIALFQRTIPTTVPGA